MSMQPTLQCIALQLVVLFAASAAFKDDAWHVDFKPDIEYDISSLEDSIGQGLAHIHESLSMMWSERAVVRPAESHTKLGIEKLGENQTVGNSQVPSNRKQMYFRPVSVTLQCVMTLTIVSLLVYTALSVSRNYDELSGEFTPSVYTQCLTIAARVSSFAPMLCMLCVACRMYVLATTEGLGEPPNWVKSCMWSTALGVILQILLVVALPMYTKKHGEEEASYDMTEGKKAAWEASHQIDDTIPPSQIDIIRDVETGASCPVTVATGDQNDVHPDLSSIELRKDSLHLDGTFWAIQVVSMLCIYGGVTGIVVGIHTFPAQSTKISAAVLCTIMISVLYFSVCFFLWLARAMSESDSPFTNAALSMSTTVRKAPMFSVLFLASRMRALNLDPPYGMPPFWMQCCFYGITACLYLETIVAGYVGATGEKFKAYYGVYMFRCHSKASHLLHHGFAIITYGLLFPIVIGVINMEGPGADGPAPLSTTLKCVLNFTVIYFGVMLAQDLIIFYEELEEHDLPMLRDSAVSAGISLGLAPLLCILFVATRMRALQITQQLGDPPGWAQDCMIVAVFATCVQSVCCLVMPIFIGEACKVDDDGNPDYDLEPMIGAYAVAVVKYVALIALHASVLTICVAVFVMTPETANASGRLITNPKHLFKGLGIVLVVFCIALLFSSAKVIGMAIKMVIESADQELIGVDITIDKVALNLFKGYVHIKKLVVHNPVEELAYAKNDQGKLVGTPTGNKCDWKSEYIAKVDLVLIKINVGRILSTLGHEFELQNLSVKGVHFVVEKPNMDLQAKNTNVEYIINYLDALGLIPPPEEPAKDEPKPEESKSPWKSRQVSDEAKPAEIVKEEPKPPQDPDIPFIIIHKIVLGDIGAGVILRNVKVVGTLQFHPTIPLIEFDDVQRDVFGGKEDLKPPEMVACIIQAIAKHVFNTVVHKIPEQLKEALQGAAFAAVDTVKSAADGALRKMPCYAEPGSRPGSPVFITKGPSSGNLD